MPSYTETRVADEYQGGGTAKGWNDDDTFWELPLPFEFPFYDEKHTTAYVSSNGFITFGQGEAWWDELPTMRGIFPYAADLYARNHTGGFDQDIRVTSSSTEVKVTWNTETFWGPGTTAYWNHTGASWIPSGGSARGWKADDASWELALPFTFPFYGEEHQTAFVSSNGYLTFGAGDTTYTPALGPMKSIQAFGKDLITQCSDTDIHTDLSSSVAKIRWQARTFAGGCSSGKKVNFEIDLYPDGLVKVGYGLIEDTAGDQVVGVSKGDGVHSVPSAKDHQVMLNGPPLGAGSSPEDLYEPDGGWPVNVEAVLKPSGEIRFRYGEMQDRHDFGQVGVSRGDGVNYQAVAGYDGQQIPSGAQTVILTRQAAASGPAISGYAASPSAVSPNGDGVKDTTTLSATWDRSATWSLAIKNGAGSTVRSSSGSGTSMSQAWDGKNSSGAVVPDGAYSAALTVTDIDGLSSSAQVTVEVDGAGPTISGLAAAPAAFSPNGDGVKDTTTISATLSESASWSLAVKNASGSTVRTYSSSGASVSQAWDGKNASGSVVANGTFTAALTATDAAGNSTTASTTVVLDTVAPAISGYAATPSAFSPNADGTKDETTFGATLTDPATPITWSLEIKNSSGAVVRTFSGQATPLSASWDGRNSLGQVVADGTYAGMLRATDDAGNTSSASTTATVDTAPPAISGLAASRNPFGPNGNGINDTTTASASFSESSTWRLDIKDGAGATRRTYTGAATTSLSRTWDGKDGSGAVVPDGIYTAAVTATDAAGNPGAAEAAVTVDTLGESAIEQHWELLDGPGSATGSRWLWLGDQVVLAHGASGLDPKPTAAFEITMRLVGATGSAGWRADLLDWDGQALGSVTLRANAAGASSHQILSATVAWPTGDRVLDALRLSPVAGATGDLSGAVEWTKAYLKVRQAGTIKRTAARARLLAGSAIAPSAGFVDPPDAAPFKMPTGFDPAPTARLVASGWDAVVRLYDLTADQVVAGSEFSPGWGDGGVPLASDALSLVAGRSYRVQVRGTQSWQGQVGGVDLVLDQATGDARGLSNTVALYEALTVPADVSADGAPPERRFNAPTVLAKAKAFSSTFVVKRTSTIGGQAGVVLSNRSTASALATATTSQGDYQLLERSISVAPGAGDDLDLEAELGTGVTGRVARADVRAALELRDSTPPVFNSFGVTPSQFSPNGDGSQDTATVSATISDGSPPIAWTVEIRDGSGALVRSYSGSTTSSVSQLWDGKNVSGTVVPDGSYTATLTATDRAGNAASRSATVRVDTVFPVVSGFVADPNPFSPNGDGDRDTTTFSATVTDDGPSSVPWRLFVVEKRSDGSEVIWNDFTGTASAGAPTASKTWDGRTEDGWVLYDGEFTGRLRATDSAGNRTVKEVAVILDASAPEVESFGASNAAFSPNGDESKDSTTFSARLSDVTSITWTLALKDEAGTIVRVFPGAGDTVSVVWDGTNDAGDPVPEGTYTALLTSTDALGHSGSESLAVDLDIVGIRALGFEAYPNPFSPDAEPPRNETTVSATLAQPLDWTLRILDAGGAPIVTTSGSGTEVSHSWSGLDGTGNPVVDGIYKAVIDAADAAGNAISEFVYIHVGSGPTIASVAPPQAQIGGSIVIAGAGFGAEPIGEHGVMVGDEDASIESWSDTAIVATVPPDLEAGVHEVTVWQGDMTSFPVEIEVLNYVLPTSLAEMNLGLINFKVREGASAAAVTARLGDPAPEVIYPEETDEDLVRWYQVNILSLQGVEDTATKIRQYAEDPDVEWVHFDPAPPELEALPNDPKFGEQWGLKQSSGIDIDADRAWDKTKGSTSVKIAIIDSGIGPHADVDGNVVGGRDYTGSGNTNDACTKSVSHGTAVAGVASAVTNNSRGIAGVGWNTKLVPYKVFRDVWVASKGRYECRMVTIRGGWTTALGDAVRDGVHIVNMSFGRQLKKTIPREQEAITAASRKGVVIVASAGNDDSKKRSYPAAYSRVMSVGAIDRQGKRAVWEDVNAGSNYGSWVDIFAPGDEILTTVVKSSSANASFCPGVAAGDSYCELRGTSLAAPFVSGTAALLRALNDRNVSIARAITASERGSPGRINARDAIDELLANMNNAEMPDGAFVKDKRPDRPTVWFLEDGTRRRVPSSRVLASWGLTASSPQIVRMEPKKLRAIPVKKDAQKKNVPLGYRPGTLISPSVDPLEQSLLTYAVTNDGSGTSFERWTMGTKRRAPPASFACLGYRANRVRSVPTSEADRHPTAAEVSGCEYPNGAIFRDDGKLWILDGGTRRELKGQVPATWGMLGDEARADVSTILANGDHPTGPILGYRPGTLIRTSPPATLYFIAAEGTDFGLGRRRAIYNGTRGTAFTKCFRFSAAAVVTASDGVLSSHVKGADVAC